MAGRRDGKARGFSLVEVIVSLGLLSGLLTAVATMFVLAGTSARSSRHLTVATALARHVMEDLERRPRDALRSLVQAGAPDPGAAFAVSDTRTPGSAADQRWGPDARLRLPAGFAVVSLTPLGGPDHPVTFASAEAVRVRLTVGWSEMRRDRSVTFEGVRF
jgi:prepilin-type N-terminal cleavage/methylation domain-containing protein